MRKAAPSNAQTLADSIEHDVRAAMQRDGVDYVDGVDERREVRARPARVAAFERARGR